ncbi:hypothetical protein YW7DRAFT_03301 [Streptomyces sp. AmelKG-E11A]|nr:hypothetical protein YW7DRAFT_03301 [Streptomyces sp. AmelKG-E11A]
MTGERPPILCDCEEQRQEVPPHAGVTACRYARLATLSCRTTNGLFKATFGKGERVEVPVRFGARPRHPLQTARMTSQAVTRAMTCSKRPLCHNERGDSPPQPFWPDDVSHSSLPTDSSDGLRSRMALFRDQAYPSRQLGRRAVTRQQPRSGSLRRYNRHGPEVTTTWPTTRWSAARWSPSAKGGHRGRSLSPNGHTAVRLRPVSAAWPPNGKRGDTHPPTKNERAVSPRSGPADSLPWTEHRGLPFSAPRTWPSEIEHACDMALRHRTCDMRRLERRLSKFKGHPRCANSAQH